MLHSAKKSEAEERLNDLLLGVCLKPICGDSGRRPSMSEKPGDFCTGPTESEDQLSNLGNLSDG